MQSLPDRRHANSRGTGLTYFSCFFPCLAFFFWIVHGLQRSLALALSAGALPLPPVAFEKASETFILPPQRA